MIYCTVHLSSRMGTRKRKACIYSALELLQQCEEENDAIIASIENAEDISSLCVSLLDDHEKSVPEKRLKIEGNFKNWFREYAMNPLFHWSPSWRTAFRVPFAVFKRVSVRLAEDLTRAKTRFRDPIPGDLKLGAFLMYIGGNSNATVAKQLGIGTSTVCLMIKEVASRICDSFKQVITFPTHKRAVSKAMQGFEGIAGLPKCAGAMGSTQVRWSACPESRQSEFVSRKEFPSIVIFAVATADRKFTFADVGRPGAQRDAGIFEQSALKMKLDQREWLTDEIAPLTISNVTVRPYFVGHSGFAPSEYIVKPDLGTVSSWNDKVIATHKPIEDAFDLLKSRFKVLQSGILLQREADISRLLLSCLILHNMCLEDGDTGDDFFKPSEGLGEQDIATADAPAGKLMRSALTAHIQGHDDGLDM